MASEINTYFGRCGCCLSYGYLKNMWEEHYRDGEKEIYIDMLKQCFALSWEPSEEPSKNDQICENCITRLRDANDFKKTVMKSRVLRIDYCGEVKDEEMHLVERVKDNIGEDKDDISLGITEPGDSRCVTPDDPIKMDYEDVEYLEDEDNEETFAIEQISQIVGRKNTNRLEREKWEKRLPKSERHKTYKQYTEEDLRACLEEVRKEKLTPKEASEKFNIPRRTITAKAKMDPKEEDEKQLASDKDFKRDKRNQLIKEIKTILTYTNAMIYKSHTSGYSCAYCLTESPYYNNPEDLRIHTKTQHIADRIKKVEYTMRPYWMHEIVKLDIHSLECIECCQLILDWNDMFKHLKTKHEVVLDLAYTRAIPYDLTDPLKCALCKQDFTYYNSLDAHMNAHYNNYVCFDCGDTFISEVRLKKHIKTHDLDKYKCSICNQKFASYKNKNRHEELIHRELPKFKCEHCDERFSREYLRHIHLLKMHKETVNVINCDVCDKSFTWQPSFRKHRTRHKNNCKMFECDICSKKCFTQIDLRDHMFKHYGEKRFTCNICDKKYVTLHSLKRHINIHKITLK